MNMQIKQRSHRRLIRRRATLFEAMAALCLLFFIFLALLQIYQWSLERLFCHYSAFHASKAMALGYRINLALRGARVAAIPISGMRRGSTSGDEKEDAEAYMTRGDASGVWYDYWYPQQNGAPEIELYGGRGDSLNTTVITLKNAPLLNHNLGRLFGIAENPEPRGSVPMYDYSEIFLED